MNLNYKNFPNNTVLSLIAPTASGKTDLAFKLFDTGRFELISVDSALIYQGMNIGTAKPTKNELSHYPHYLVNIIKPTDTYSVANFINDVERLIENIHQRGKIPLLVGGTMMYYMALFDGISAVPETLASVREHIAKWRQAEGNAALYAYLKMHDPKICEKITVHDTQRLTRAVEVYWQTGVPMSVHQTTPKTALSHDTRWHWQALAVMPDRAWLHERIERRLEMMWAEGFVSEVLELIDKYPSLSADMPSMRCVGYRQVLDFLLYLSGKDDGQEIAQKLGVNVSNVVWSWLKIQKTNTKNTLMTQYEADDTRKACQVMKNQALYATRQLAKRQYTWLRQLSNLGTPTITDVSIIPKNVTITSFDSIKEVEKHLL
ncbi:MAG: tRNA (adenosine(37)-N6)-dimethylallyltransferase MiaA [Moraxella sp.]|nr:tRNA (adenosine(37)-N6)-dimethylallyltransferase MiaA [Moraxella sp.]